MTIRASIAILALSVCWGPVAQARGSVPIVAHDNMLLTAASAGPLTTDQVRGAIIRAAITTPYPWAITAGGDNALVASTVVRGKHTAEVTIGYTRSTITVTYRDSRNLNYRVKDGVRKGYSRRGEGSVCQALHRSHGLPETGGAHRCVLCRPGNSALGRSRHRMVRDKG